MGKNKREEYAAILAVGERGEAVVVKWLRQEEWMREAASMWDTLKETVFEEDAGFYYAKMVCSACGGDKCLGEPCDGGCRDVQWEIGERVDVACISEVCGE